jgi:LysR family glycine cleavage system transcriptional activator
MRKIPPLNSLRAFEAAARHMSFSKAADELCVTATAISHQIKPLEDTIDLPLFRRTPRPIVLTLAGEGLFPTIRVSFVRMAQVVEDVKHDEPPLDIRP